MSDSFFDRLSGSGEQRERHRRHRMGYALWLAVLVPPVGAPGADRPMDAAPERIITIAPNAAEVICALGECARIVGVDRFSAFPEELASRPRVGGLFDPDLEKIVALRPDLVVLRGRGESLEKLCAELGIPLYRDRTERLEDIARTALELGARLNRNTEARALVGEFESRLRAVQERVRGLPKPRVLLTVSRRPDEVANLLTTGKDTFLDDMIRVAGGVNIFGDIDAPWPQVSVEGILVRQPEVIVELMPGADVDGEHRRMLVEPWRALGDIPAVSHDRIVFLTDDHVLIPSPRVLRVLELLAEGIHGQGRPRGGVDAGG